MNKHLIEAAKQALEALYLANTRQWPENKIGAAINALSAAIEQAEKQEPVAAQHRFRYPQKTMPDWSPWQPATVANRPSWEIDSQGYETEYRNLYTTPPTAQRQPLTERELQGYFLRTNTAEPLAEGWPGLERFARAIEAAHGITGVKK